MILYNREFKQNIL